jgi:hypothetical protein
VVVPTPDAAATPVQPLTPPALHRPFFKTTAAAARYSAVASAEWDPQGASASASRVSAPSAGMPVYLLPQQQRGGGEQRPAWAGAQPAGGSAGGGGTSTSGWPPPAATAPARTPALPSYLDFTQSQPSAASPLPTGAAINPCVSYLSCLFLVMARLTTEGVLPGRRFKRSSVKSLPHRMRLFYNMMLTGRVVCFAERSVPVLP